MSSPLARRLIVVTGKGGTGKTTVTAALGLLAARRGRRVVLVEMSGQRRLPALLASGKEMTDGPAGEALAPGAAAEVELGEGLWSTSIDPDQALLDWLAVVGGRVPARLLASRSSFRYFAAAAPGAKELLSLVRVWELTERERWQGRGGGYDLAILDAPATGHALAMLRSPSTFGAIARVGPIAAQARRVGQLLADPARSAYIATSLASEAAVSETLELAEALRADPGRELDRVVVNGVFSRRFSRAELDRVRGLDAAAEGDPAAGAMRAVLEAADFVEQRSRRQRSQLARLRRAHMPTVLVPFAFTPRLDRAAVENIAKRLERALEEGSPNPRPGASPSPATASQGPSAS